MGKPKIRFKGYEDDWEQRKVTDLGEIYIGLVTTMTEHYTDKGHLLIRNSDIKDGYFEFGENPIYLDGEFSEQNKSRMHQLGDVITVHTGDIGTSAVIGENEVNSIGFATIVTRPNQKILDSNYFATYLNTDTHKQWAISMATGDGRSNYNLKDYTKLVVPIPQIEEQKKIATCIGNLNNLITLHQRKCEETKSLKKYMLQKMFPENGKCVPEIRFSGFSDDWEQRKLSEIAIEKLSNGIMNNQANDETGLRHINVINMYDPDKIHPEKLTFSNYDEDAVKKCNVEWGDIFLTRSSLKPEGIAESNVLLDSGRFVYDDHLIRLKLDKEKYDPFFVKLNLSGSIFKRQFIARAKTTAFTTIGQEDIAECFGLFPEKEEQEKIGTYFSNLDHLITLHQHKCDELQKLKKFMLQNMFV